jgi:hypothetical protein
MSAPYAYRPAPWRPKPPRVGAVEWVGWLLCAAGGLACWWSCPAWDWLSAGAGLAAGSLALDLYHTLGRR